MTETILEMYGVPDDKGYIDVEKSREVVEAEQTALMGAASTMASEQQAIVDATLDKAAYKMKEKEDTTSPLSPGGGLDEMKANFQRIWEGPIEYDSPTLDTIGYSSVFGKTPPGQEQCIIL